MAEIVSVAPPVFCSVTVWFEVVPVVTFPNGTGLGAIPTAGGVTPVPLRFIVGEVVALLVNVTVPLLNPVPAGANVTDSV